MTKPTYSELVDLVRYLAYRADYENLPMLDDVRDAVEYCVENATYTSFKNESEIE